MPEATARIKKMVPASSTVKLSTTNNTVSRVRTTATARLFTSCSIALEEQKGRPAPLSPSVPGDDQ